MKTWKIKRTGRTQYILLFILLTMLVYMLFALQATTRYGGTFLQNFFEGIFIFIIIILAWFATFIPMIRRLKIPIEIVIEPELDLLKLVYSEDQYTGRNLSSIGYNFQDHGLFCIFRFLDRRAYSWRKHLTIFGILIGNGWNKKQLHEIADYLEQNNTQFISKKKYKA